mmetsp:Transcript_33267/g.54958  ORF Transcript_33267/g.54958 Transcript_33267/m.54958 type:complete len:183 (-) Transcript_33267:362-910(-)
MGIVFSSIWQRLFGTGEYKIVMVGLDNAGKTTVLYRLHLGDVIETHPTVGSNVEEVTHRNIRFQVWDLGGQDKLRRVWSTYYVGAHAVVLVVDSMDRARLPLLRDEFASLTANDELAASTLLVLANKQDLEGALTAVEITQQLQLHTCKQHAWQIQPCSAVSGKGLYEGMDWLAHTLKNRGR